MSGYANPPSINPYWYYESQGYQPNTSIPFPSHDSVDSPTHSSFDMYTNRFVDSGYLSRTPTPPTPVRNPSPAPVPFRTRNEQDPQHENDGSMSEQSTVESKPRLPYVKRTRIQYTMQQLQILEEAFQNNHYPEVTTVDALAELLDVRHEKISIWFQNRRSRFKRQQKPKSSSSSSTITVGAPKKLTHISPIQTGVASPTYDPSASYYSPYFWPSPIMDNRAAPPYPTSHQNSSFYESYGNPTTNSMWGSANTTYSSPASWHQSPTSTMNHSLTSSPSPAPSLLPEHLSSM